MTTAALAPRCPDCGADVAPTWLACTRCLRLRHRDELNALAARANAAAAAGDVVSSLAAWRSALELLPPGSRQHEQVLVRVRALSEAVDRGTSPAAGGDARPGKEPGRGARRAAGATALGAALWKLKFALGFVLGQGKLLLLGFTKLGTVLSMLVSFAAYWAAYGWRFATGLLLAIYVHEIGHVAALRQFGIEASAPMFVPGFGAVVRLKQYPVTPVEDARVGLAGPRWGLFASLAALALAFATRAPVMFALAKTSAWINLFNLVPVWQLDGSRGFRALDREQRRWACGAAFVAWFATRESMALLVLLGAGFRAFEKAVPERGDRRALYEYVVLVGAFAALSALRS